jgi:hypothetical protein
MPGGIQSFEVIRITRIRECVHINYTALPIFVEQQPNKTRPNKTRASSNEKSFHEINFSSENSGVKIHASEL